MRLDIYGYEIFDRRNGEVVNSNLKKEDAELKLAGIFVEAFKSCLDSDINQQQLLASYGTPYAMRKIGSNIRKKPTDDALAAWNYLDRTLPWEKVWENWDSFNDCTMVYKPLVRER